LDFSPTRERGAPQPVSLGVDERPSLVDWTLLWARTEAVSKEREWFGVT
jgi:hypothetical protein